jgi:Rad52/22 family double-strand break repair protein
MAFTEAQVKSLEAKLSAKRIKTRQANGVTLAYVEGWHVIAEANRIFGYDAWDRRTRTNNCVWSGTKGEGKALTPVKPMSWRSKRPKLTPRSGRLLHLAIRLVWHFTTTIKLAFEKCAMARVRQRKT